MARFAARIAGAGLLLASLAAGVAQAQSTVITSGSSKEDQSLTWHGITLYGIVDLGFSYETHGAPISDYFPAGISEPVQKFSNKSVNGLTPNNLSQSRIGLSGTSPSGVTGRLSSGSRPFSTRSRVTSATAPRPSR